MFIMEFWECGISMSISKGAKFLICKLMTLIYIDDETPFLEHRYFRKGICHPDYLNHLFAQPPPKDLSSSNFYIERKRGLRWLLQPRRGNSLLSWSILYLFCCPTSLRWTHTGMGSIVLVDSLSGVPFHIFSPIRSKHLIIGRPEKTLCCIPWDYIAERRGVGNNKLLIYEQIRNFLYPSFFIFCEQILKNFYYQC